MIPRLDLYYCANYIIIIIINGTKTKKNEMFQRLER